MGLTVTAIAVAVVILASNFTIINAQQPVTHASNLEKLRMKNNNNSSNSTTKHFKAQMTASAYRCHKDG